MAKKKPAKRKSPARKAAKTSKKAPAKKAKVSKAGGRKTPNPAKAGRKKSSKKSGKICGQTKHVRRPRSWEKAILAAYVVMLGGTSEQAAAAAGCSKRSVEDWRMAPWWADAKTAAEDRWLDKALSAAQVGLLAVLRDKDAATVRWVLERLRSATFAPPTQNHKVDATATVHGVQIIKIGDQEIKF